MHCYGFYGFFEGSFQGSARALLGCWVFLRALLMSAVKRLSSPILGRQIGHVRPKLTIRSWSLSSLLESAGGVLGFFVVVSCCLLVISSWNPNCSVVMVGALLVGAVIVVVVLYHCLASMLAKLGFKERLGKVLVSTQASIAGKWPKAIPSGLLLGLEKHLEKDRWQSIWFRLV